MGVALPRRVTGPTSGIGELKMSEFGGRFPYFVKCNACGWSTDLVRLPGIAVKLWNDAKRPKSEKGKR
jgi:hypothetical protein